MVSDKGTEVAEIITNGQIVGTNSEKLKVGDLERERERDGGSWNPGE